MYIQDRRQLDTILAALRFWQRKGNEAGIPEMSVAEETGTALLQEEIDELCIHLQTAEPVVVVRGDCLAITDVQSNMPARVIVLDANIEGANDELPVIKLDRPYAEEFAVVTNLETEPDEDLISHIVSKVL